MNSEKLWVSVAEAAELLSVSKPVVYALCNAEGFPCVRIGRAVRISMEGLRTWAAAQQGNKVEVEICGS